MQWIQAQQKLDFGLELILRLEMDENISFRGHLQPQNELKIMIQLFGEHPVVCDLWYIGMEKNFQKHHLFFKMNSSQKDTKYVIMYSTVIVYQ